MKLIDFHLQMKLLPPAFLAWMPLAHISAVEVRNRQHPSRKEDTSVPLCPKQFGFFKCLEVKPSGSHSSSNSAGPQENKAAGTWLCVMLPHHNSSIFLKTIKLSERTQITEVSGAEVTPCTPGTTQVVSTALTGGQGQTAGKETKKCQFL